MQIKIYMNIVFIIFIGVPYLVLLFWLCDFYVVVFFSNHLTLERGWYCSFIFILVLTSKYYIFQTLHRQFIDFYLDD